MQDFILNMDPNAPTTHQSKEAIIVPTNTMNVANNIQDVLRFSHIQFYAFTQSNFVQMTLPDLKSESMVTLHKCSHISFKFSLIVSHNPYRKSTDYRIADLRRFLGLSNVLSK